MLIFFLICLFVWLLAWLCQRGKYGIITATVLLFISLHIWASSTLTWYGKQVVSPKISLQIVGSPEPLLGEMIEEVENNIYHITLTDHRLNASGYDRSPNINVTITPENATTKKAKAQLTIKQTNNTSTRDLSTTMKERFSYTIGGSDLINNEVQGTEPTIFNITAENAVGKTTIQLVVTHYPLYRACTLYSETHPGRSSIEDITLCRERADADSQSNKPASNNSTGTSTNKTPSSCFHYEAGRCWDEIDDKAYDDGYFDGRYGSVGSGYNPPEDCTGLCLDIYEDAYYEGLWGY